MGIQFTPAQQKVLDARGHNILVSAAAGSGKTAVLVERIVRLVSEGDHPADIDRLLVVTFTRAAAAQMRERIGQALAARLRDDPANTHLQQQEVLLHNAQITTMDSFFTFLLRNFFSDIDLDPGFRQIDATESRLLAAQVLEDFLEDKYAEADPGFLHCAAYFSPGADDSGLVDLIGRLCNEAGSHPSPEAWLRERALDYDIPDERALFAAPWMRSMVLRTADLLLESDSAYEAMKEICRQPAGPDICLPFFEEEQTALFAGVRRLYADFRQREEEGPAGPQDAPAAGTDQSGSLSGDGEILRRLWEEILRSLSHTYARYPSTRGKKYAYIDEDLKKAAKSMRDAGKARLTDLKKKLGGQSAEMILTSMEMAREPMRTLSELAVEYRQRLQAFKRDRHVIDFVDLEHLALDILADRQEDGSYLPRRAALALRSHYTEILIDEYQDSNEVQELMLQIISGEDAGRNNRFMVGDIKQSIYRFRLARPEIFMEKYDRYREDDPETERIELDQNFRSRGQVLDCVNALFMRIMRREVGGVDYNSHVSLKKGAVFPDGRGEDPYRAELLLLDTEGAEAENAEAPGNKDRGAAGADSDPGAGPEAAGEPETGRGESAEDGGDRETWQEEADGISILSDEVRTLTDRQKEALLIAGRIRQLVGVLLVRDENTGCMRPARYGDIVILVRSTVGWNEDLRAVFDNEGIPAYAESKTGYFAAREVRDLIELLRVLDNPRQDIPLYGVLRGYFGDFSEEEIVRIRLAAPEAMLIDALYRAAGEDGRGAETVSGHLREKSAAFLAFLHQWRERARFSTVAEIVTGLLEETGYEDYCTALPAGVQRAANLRFLRTQADAFTRTDMTGLFAFLQYIDGLHRQEIDYGEPNTLDEKADVVRIMSIHKSKGLEFPVCFVAGLSKAMSFRRFDAAGPMLFDGDWGCGIYYCDVTSRVRATTARREEIAEKIRRDCMGEELRVLYVAMTRAKEKLILTASDRGLFRKIADWQSQMAGHFHHADAFRLSPSRIGQASSYLQLILEAVFAHEGRDADLEDLSRDAWRDRARTDRFPLQVQACRTEDLTMQAAADQLDLSRARELLRGLEGRPMDRQPDPEAARTLADSLFRAYPHEELRDLYAQTSVSEIKHRAMQTALRHMEEGTAESSAELFPQKTPVPYIPAFAAREGAVREEAGLGARRGTAFHRILELMDYGRLSGFCREGQAGREALLTWIRSLGERYGLTEEEISLVDPAKVLTFCRSPLASRMAAADREKKLYREQPFVMGVSADRLDRAFPAGEIVTVQGIIDAFFIEGDAVILVDYKTDRVRAADELILRYRAQLDLYAEALEHSFGLPVREKILYSTALGGEILL